MPGCCTFRCGCSHHCCIRYRCQAEIAYQTCSFPWRWPISWPAVSRAAGSGPTQAAPADARASGRSAHGLGAIRAASSARAAPGCLVQPLHNGSSAAPWFCVFKQCSCIWTWIEPAHRLCCCCEGSNPLINPCWQCTAACAASAAAPAAIKAAAKAARQQQLQQQQQSQRQQQQLQYWQHQQQYQQQQLARAARQQPAGLSASGGMSHSVKEHLALGMPQGKRTMTQQAPWQSLHPFRELLNFFDCQTQHDGKLCYTQRTDVHHV